MIFDSAASHIRGAFRLHRAAFMIFGTHIKRHTQLHSARRHSWPGMPAQFWGAADTHCGYALEGTDSRLCVEDGRCVLCCRDVHGDVGVVVLSLRWPATSWNQALEAPVKSLLQLQNSANPDAAAACLRARQRWNQLKTLYIEFVRARR